MKCPDCGMVYVRDDASDRSRHRKFHDEVINGVPMPSIKRENTIWRNADNRIFLVTPFSTMPERVRARKVGRMANLETQYDFGLYNEHEPPDERNIHLFIYCRNDRAIALAIFERRTNVCLYSWGEYDRGVEKPLEVTNPVWSLGFIWVHSGYRRGGIANALFLTSVRFLGVSLETVGVYTPFTDSGETFARSIFPNQFIIAK